MLRRVQIDDHTGGGRILAEASDAKSLYIALIEQLGTQIAGRLGVGEIEDQAVRIGDYLAAQGHRRLVAISTLVRCRWCVTFTLSTVARRLCWQREARRGPADTAAMMSTYAKKSRYIGDTLRLILAVGETGGGGCALLSNDLWGLAMRFWDGPDWDWFSLFAFPTSFLNRFCRRGNLVTATQQIPRAMMLRFGMTSYWDLWSRVSLKSPSGVKSLRMDASGCGFCQTGPLPDI